MRIINIKKQYLGLFLGFALSFIIYICVGEATMYCGESFSLGLLGGGSSVTEHNLGCKIYQSTFFLDDGYIFIRFFIFAPLAVILGFFIGLMNEELKNDVLLKNIFGTFSLGFYFLIIAILFLMYGNIRWHEIGEKKDPKFCETKQRQDLQDDCFKYLAGDTKDINICGKLHNFSAGCYYRILEEVKDIKLCENEQGYAEECFKQFIKVSHIKDPNICDTKVQESLKDICYRSYGSMYDISYCNYIKDVCQKAPCISSFIYQLAAKEKDSSRSEELLKQAGEAFKPYYANKCE